MPFKIIKDKNRTGTFKFIGLDQNEEFQNEEERQFDSIMKKEITVHKVNEL